jgi:gamma-glutamyltranspeptidase/glutathione hydrolase
VDGHGLELAAGSAGGTRIRSALVQSLSGILDEELTPQDAVDRPRLHPVGRLVHLEPGFAPEAGEALAAEGWDVRAWEARHHYFGGVSLLGRAGGAADPRRSGAVLSLPA